VLVHVQSQHVRFDISIGAGEGSRGCRAIYSREQTRSLPERTNIDAVPLIERRLKLTELVARSDIHCLHVVQAFDDGVKLLEAAERHGLEGIVSKRQASAYRSGPSHDWVKAKTAAWRTANRDRWRAFQRRR